jgi:hypothetical protein
LTGDCLNSTGLPDHPLRDELGFHDHRRAATPFPELYDLPTVRLTPYATVRHRALSPEQIEIFHARHAGAFYTKIQSMFSLSNPAALTRCLVRTALGFF